MTSNGCNTEEERSVVVVQRSVEVVQSLASNKIGRVLSRVDLDRTVITGESRLDR